MAKIIPALNNKFEIISSCYKFIRKMTDKIKIHKIKNIKQKHYNTIEVRIGDIDAFCEPDGGASANIMDEYQFKALKRTNIG